MDQINTNEAVNDADAYVRDHLLIEWCIENLNKYIRTSPTEIISIEDMYDDWILWLKEKEAEHAERGKI